MRIVLMPSAFHPAVGGVEELTYRIARELLRRGHVVEVWAAQGPDGALLARDQVDSIPIRRFGFSAPALRARTLLTWPFGAARSMLALVHAVRSFRPQIIHVICFSNNGAYATVLSRWTKTPLVVTLQGETVMDDHDIFEHSHFLRTLLRRGLRRASVVTACSDFTLRDARERFGLPAAKGQVIFNGVDLAETTEKAVAIPFDRYIFGVGRLVQKKGFDLLLAAWARIERDHPDVGLVIAGRGEASATLVARANELGIRDRVYFPGVLSRPEVVFAMRRAEVFVMPSRIEPFGIVALEAWRAGRPIVVTSRGGAPEFVRDGVSGRVVDPFDTTALSAAITEMLSDPPGADVMGNRGRAMVAAFDWSRLVDSYETAYQQICPSFGTVS